MMLTCIDAKEVMELHLRTRVMIYSNDDSYDDVSNDDEVDDVDSDDDDGDDDDDVMIAMMIMMMI